MNTEIVRRRLLRYAQPATAEPGQMLYHFSNLQHPIGYTGHTDMFFTEGSQFYDQESDVDPKKTVYRHICEVITPEMLVDPNFESLVVFLSQVRWDQFERSIKNSKSNLEGTKWYKAKSDGAVRIIDNDVYQFD